MLGKFRITEPTLDVLEELLRSDADESYGFKIAQAIGRPTGSVFPILARLERNGWAVSEWETRQSSERGARKRLYRLSPEGAARARVVLADRRPPAPTPVPNNVGVGCPGILRPRVGGRNECNPVLSVLAAL